MGRCNQITNICVRVDWWKQSIGVDYYSGGGGSEPEVNLIAASTVIRATANGAGNPITWNFINGGGHSPVYFDSITVDSLTGDIVIGYPNVGKVITAIIGNDESYTGVMAFPSISSINQNELRISVYQCVGVYGGWAVGNGVNWDFFGDLTDFDIVTNTIDGFTFNPPAQFVGQGANENTDFYWRSALGRYSGLVMDRFCKKILTGLGDAKFGYSVIDSLGVTIADNSSDDIIEIITNTPKFIKIDFSKQEADGFPSNLLGGTTNFWIQALFEA